MSALGGNDFGLDDISFGTLSTFIRLVSDPGTDAQTPCVNTPITPIVYSVGSTASGPTITGLPPGLTTSFNGVLFTITGTPTTPGTYTYTVSTAGTCNQPSTATGTITVQGDNVTLSTGNASPVVCVNTPVNVGFTLSGTATGINPTATILPAGFTIDSSGTDYVLTGQSAIAGVYPYKIVTKGGCNGDTARGTITVNAQTITLNSNNDNQTLCINTPLENIQYTLGGTAAGASITSGGLPAGVSLSVNGGVVFISGTPTQAGTFNYTMTTSGDCAPVSASGTIIVTPDVTFSLTSANSSQTLCINTAVEDIVYDVNGATSASVTGLPSGVSGSYSAGKFTISGTPSESGTFNYSVTSSGGCGTATTTGTITVQQQVITLSTGNSSPTLCQSEQMTDIVYTIGGTATGASISGQPAGVTGTLNANGTFTVSGTPTESGTFTYTITLTGTCATETTTGTITVSAAPAGGAIATVSICSGGSGTLTLTGQTGTVVGWEYSTDNTNWTPIANTTISQAYTNITVPTMYRALLNNGCGSATSGIGLVAIHNYWIGVTSIDWNDGTNWSDGMVPSMSCPNVYIPSGTPNEPTLGSGTAAINNLYVYPGATLTVNSTGILEIAGAINSANNIDMKAGTLEFNGTSTQSIDGNMFVSNTVNNLIISSQSGSSGLNTTGAANDTLKISAGLSFGNVNNKKLDSSGGHLTLLSTLAGTAWVADLTNNGANSGNDVVGSVTVERYINSGPGHGKSWQLLAVPTQGQTIQQSWMEGASASNVIALGAAGPANPHPGYGTMTTSDVANAGTFPSPAFDVHTPPGPSIKVYNTLNDTYVGPPNTDKTPIYNKKGYLVLVRGDRSVYAYNQPANPTILRTTGKLFTPNNPPPSSTVAQGLFESVGNPYASAIDLKKIALTDNATQVIIVWDPKLTGIYGLGAFQYLAQNPGTGDDNFYATPGQGSYGSYPTPNNYIQSGQAFFIEANPAGGNGSVSFNEQLKAGAGSNKIVLRGNNAGLSQLRANLYGLASNGSPFLTDGNLLQYGKSLNNKIDVLDARKMVNSYENFGILSGGDNLAIERRNGIVATDTIFYRLSGLVTQKYRLEYIATGLSQYGLQGFIEDTYLNTRKPLNMEGLTSLDFSATTDAASRAANRFRIVFKTASPLALQVVLAALTAEQKGNDILVTWKVKNEKDLLQYEVEKSTDGVNFVKIATAAALNQGAANYQVTDPKASYGDNYYRIKIIGLNGETSYTAVVKVNVPYIAPAIRIHPNPITDGIIHLQFINQPAGTYMIRLLNPLGQTVVAKQVGHAGGNATETIKWNYYLAHGVYQLEVVKPGGAVDVIKVMY